MVTAATIRAPAVQPRRCFDLDRRCLCPGRAPCTDDVADDVDIGLGLETGRWVDVMLVAMVGEVVATCLGDWIALVRAESC